MLKLKKLNGTTVVINCDQILAIELIPETKIIMMNHDFYIVQESVDVVMQKVIEYHAKILDVGRTITISDYRQ
nr:flagellar FlbD family protein [uncultured Butyricicoccus sp.]